MTPTKGYHGIDDVTREGIRYHALEQVIKKLKRKEKKCYSRKTLTKKNNLKKQTEKICTMLLGKK